MFEWIQFIVGTAFLLTGIVIFAIELYGSFHYDYVLNRMHMAAFGDTVGIGISLLGLMIISGLHFTTLKRITYGGRKGMTVFTYLLMGFLILCAIAVSLSKNLLNSILIYMSYSLIMSIIWTILESPDLAITEAAVGAGVTSILFFVTLKKIHAIDEKSGGRHYNE